MKTCVFILVVVAGVASQQVTPQIQADSSSIAFAIQTGLNLSINYFNDGRMTPQTFVV
eukprot:m.414344 g.414344  ORF g.414344 m.414344 type:complete len:58 (-) comp21269_c0_seq11:1965-2138(-)